MPVYNAESYLGEAIRSILDQTFDNLELIVIDDGSTDNSLAEIQSVKDERIRLYKNEWNQGIVYSRNKGLSLAKGDYIGMFDADDVAYPEKFEDQINFLEKNKDFGMVGSWVKFVNEKGKRLPGGWKLKASPEMIPAIMLFKNYFLQSAVLYRQECISKFSFREGFEIGEDFLIWLDILAGYKAWNLQKYLVNYRIHEENITNQKIEEKLKNEKAIFRMQLHNLGIDPTDREMGLHLLIRSGSPINEISTLKAIEKWLLKIITRNEDLEIYNNKMLIKVIFNRWVKVCYKASGLRVKMLYHFFTSEIFLLFIQSYKAHNTN